MEEVAGSPDLALHYNLEPGTSHLLAACKQLLDLLDNTLVPFFVNSHLGLLRACVRLLCRLLCSSRRLPSCTCCT